MTKYLLEGFEPQRVLRHFEDLCAIPHGSGHEEALADHIVALAQKGGHEVYRDSMNNVLVRVAATPGYETAAPFLLQGHLDMVLAKEEGVDIDLEREPVRLILEGNVLRADRTTLGADNGVGLCNMMALMEADDLIHPELELLFTVEEETGMGGIKHFDMRLLKARRMINMDCGDPDVLVMGAAGGAKYALERQCESTPVSGAALRIEISGLLGGHSGIEVGKNRASAMDLGGRVLAGLCDKLPVRLAAMESPTVGNGIPQKLAITVVVPADKLAEAEAICQEYDAAFAAEVKDIEDGYTMTLCAAEATETMSEADTRALADFMLLIPYEAIRRSHINPKWVLCSGLLTQANYAAGQFTGKFAIRANRDSYRDAAVQRFLTLCRMTGVEATQLSPFSPAWPEKEVSPFRDLCLQLYRELYGEEMVIQVEHGGVEPAEIALAIPDMDIVGFAPKSRGAHTTREHLFVETVKPFWQMLTALLERLAKLPE